jgi:PPK2 family polyphosphate:nucleotide phosphotransferase
MKIRTDDYRVQPGQRVDLAEWPTLVKLDYGSDDDYDKELRHRLRKLDDLQYLLYAGDSHALLLVFQGMDTAGKDGCIREVMSGLDPHGFEVSSFKQPSAAELQQDFLWRTTRRLPERGRIGIFNRSYYEEVIVVRVHPQFLAGQGISPDVGRDFWTDRFRSINEHEAHLVRNRTRPIKFLLHVSLDEQRKRLLSRLEEPKKHWKFRAGDLKEREYWSAYMSAYSACLSATSTAEAPWYVIPADDKKSARLAVAEILIGHLEALDLHYPPPSLGKEELAAYAASLAKPA